MRRVVHALPQRRFYLRWGDTLICNCNRFLVFYYKALKEFNEKLRLIRLLNRVADIDEMKLGELKHYLNLLTRAKTEEEFNEILNNAKESK